VPVAIFVAAVVIYAAVAAQDLWQRQVSNLLCAGIAVLGIVRWVALMQIAPAAWAAAAALALFCIGILFYSRGWLGAGDVKLIAATALLVGGIDLGGADIMAFLFLMSALGSVLALGLIVYRIFGHFRGKPAASADGAAVAESDHAKVPYAVAVAIAATIVLFLQIQRA